MAFSMNLWKVSGNELSEIQKTKLLKEERLEDWRIRAEKSSMSEYALENLVRMFEYYDQWGLVGNPNVLSWLLGREPSSLETFFDRVIHENNASE